MKKSELRQLIAEYKKLKLQIKKKNPFQRIMKQIKQVEQRYYHETGKELTRDIMES